MSKKSRPSRPLIKSPSWQVIYMDLMTIIMVFFVIIWSLSQGKEDGISETIGDITTRLINLPGDVLFGAGQTKLSADGKKVLNKIFQDENGKSVLRFENDGLVKRMIVFHGHTDADGKKASNFSLGYQRALAAYHEIKRYTKGLEDHAIICTHASNSSVRDIPKQTASMSKAQKELLKGLKAKQRRISIEDRSVNRFEEEE